MTTTENWPLPAVVVAYHITSDGHPDSYPLHLTSKILSDGESSRIYKSLVYDKGIAVSAFGGGNIIEEPNLFFAVALVQRGHTPEEAERALIAEFDKLRAEPVSERELQRAKNQFFRDYITRPRIHPGQGRAAGARGGHPPRRHDGGRRGGDVQRSEGGRRAARGPNLFHPGESSGADDSSEDARAPR